MDDEKRRRTTTFETFAFKSKGDRWVGWWGLPWPTTLNESFVSANSAMYHALRKALEYRADLCLHFPHKLFSSESGGVFYSLLLFFIVCVCSMAVFVWLDTVRVESIHIYLVRRSSVPFRILNQLSNVDKFPFKRLMPFYLSVVYAPKSMCGGPSKYLLHNSPRVVSAQ